MTNVRLNNRWFVACYGYRLAWLHFTWTVETLAQKDDLERLIRWAHRKKLTGIGRHYKRLRDNVEMRLTEKALRYPGQTRLAEWAYCVYSMLSPTPDFYPKKAAAKYRLRNRSLI